MKRGMSSGYGRSSLTSTGRQLLTGTALADIANPMFFMPGTRMLFGDAKTSCDGKSYTTFMLYKGSLTHCIAIKAGLEAKQ